MKGKNKEIIIAHPLDKLWMLPNAATKRRVCKAKICILKDICTEIIFMKYKEEIQVITTVNEF